MAGLGLTACGPQVRDGDAAAVVPGDTSSAPRDPRVAAADLARIRGDSSAKVWLVMVSDLQCPACRLWHDNYSAEIMRDYVETGKVRFAYLNFPLNIHQNSRPAAEAAMCAGAQDKFWPMVDGIFAAQDSWAVLPDPTPRLREVAVSAGVDTTAWNSCVREHIMGPMIDGDLQRGTSSGVNQTPTFFVGNKVVAGAVPASDLRPLLDAAIAEAGGASR